ncbi:MAG: hypothetical protein LBB49_03695 [Gracilibacteraceae bacterium]|jgi:hypothetical protein|nr:hypothetical protein [Gracilibacteraceae bacterium]
MENIEVGIVVTDSNRDELEKLYGKIPPESKLLEAPQTHSFEESQQNQLDKFIETEEVALDEISEQNI